MADGVITALHLQTDWVCNSGTVLAVIPASRWELVERIDQFVVWKTLTVSIPLSWESADEVYAGRVINAYFRIEGTSGMDWEEYRITDERVDVVSQTVTVTAVYYLQDLIEKDALVSQTVDGAVSFSAMDFAVTPTTALDNRVIALLPSYWGRGTVTPSGAIDVSYSNATPLQAAMAIAAAVKASTGVTYEIWAQRNSFTDIYIMLTQVGTANTWDVRTGKNLASVRRTKRRGDQTTRVGFSADAALRRPTYVVSAVSASTYVDVTDILARRAPAREADQWNALYLIEWKNGTTHQITDTVVSSYGTTRLYVASTTTLTVGDYVYLAADASKTDLSYVDSPALQATWGKRLGVLPGEAGVTNHVRNADFASTTTGWTVSGSPNETTTAGFWRQGGRSYQVIAGEALSQSRTVYLEAGDTVVCVLSLYMPADPIDNPTSACSAVQVFGDTYYTTGSVAGSVTTEPEFVQPGWKTFVRSKTYASAGAISVAVGVSGNTYARNVYVDAAAIYVLRPGQSAPSSVLLGSGAAKDVAAANDHLDTNGTPPATYEVDAADVYLKTPNEYLTDIPILGGTMYLTDDTLNESRTALRMVQVSRSSDRVLGPSVLVSTLPRRLTALLASGA